MTPRTAGRLLLYTMLVGVSTTIACLGISAAATAASLAGRSGYQAPNPSASGSTATSKTDIRSLTITGPGLRHPLTFRQDHQTAQYNTMIAEVTWMDGRTGDVIESTPSDLGPDYTVTLLTGNTVTATYDLFPEVPGGPRSHRQATSTTDEAWFFAPIDMASALASVGVKIPVDETAAQSAFTQPAVATTAPRAHLTDLIRQSRAALVLAGIAAAGILVLLGYAARRSRQMDRRMSTVPAIARLQSVKARAASGRGAVLRSATPPVPAPRRPVSTSTRAVAPPTRPERPTGIARVATGPTDLIGPTVPTGPSGSIGRVGPTGPSGSSGLVGPVGPTIPIGSTGQIDPSGSINPTSPTGPTSQIGPIPPASSTPLTRPLVQTTRAIGRASVPTTRSVEVAQPIITGTDTPHTQVSPDPQLPDLAIQITNPAPEPVVPALGALAAADPGTAPTADSPANADASSTTSAAAPDAADSHSGPTTPADSDSDSGPATTAGAPATADSGTATTTPRASPDPID